MSLFLTAMMLAPASTVPPCRSQQIALSLDRRDGDFNGMSHSGTRLILHNRGAVCRIVGMPLIDFTDARGRPLPIVRNVPVGMHPGPAALPITVPMHGVVSTPLRWISGEVFYSSRCFLPRSLRITIGGSAVSSRFAGRLCGPAAKPAGFDQPLLRPDTKDTPD